MGYSFNFKCVGVIVAVAQIAPLRCALSERAFIPSLRGIFSHLAHTRPPTRPSLLVRSNGAPALAGSYLVDMLNATTDFEVDEKPVENGLQQIDLTHQHSRVVTRRPTRYVNLPACAGITCHQPAHVQIFRCRVINTRS